MPVPLTWPNPLLFINYEDEDDVGYPLKFKEYVSSFMLGVTWVGERERQRERACESFNRVPKNFAYSIKYSKSLVTEVKLLSHLCPKFYRILATIWKAYSITNTHGQMYRMIRTNLQWGHSKSISAYFFLMGC